MFRREFLKSTAAYALTSEQDSIGCLACDGSRIAVGVGKLTRVFDKNLRPIETLEGHTDRIESVAINYDRVASGSFNGLILEWAGRKERRERHDHAIYAMGYRGNELCHGGYCDTVVVGDKKLVLDCTDVRALATDGKSVVVGGRSKNLYALTSKGGQTWNVPTSDVTALTWYRKSIVWGGKRGQIGTLNDHEKVANGDVSALCTIDSNYAAVGTTANELVVVHVPTLSVRAKLEGCNGTITGLACIGTTVYAGCWDGVLRIYDIRGVR